MGTLPAKNKTGAILEQISDYTNYSFKNHKWQEPEIIQIKTSDKDTVYARLYTPNANAKNNAAVIFVHGAGYLQNAQLLEFLFQRIYVS